MPLIAGILINSGAFCQNLSPQIRLNQVGFYPGSPKIAILAKDISGKFMITSPDLTQIFYTGELSGPKKSSYSPNVTRMADFSSFAQAGVYVVWVPEVGFSYQFEIKPKVNQDLAAALMKSYYYQRMSIPLSYDYAGKWSRPAGHPDNKVLIHPSAATPQRPEGTVISSPKVGTMPETIISTLLTRVLLWALCFLYMKIIMPTVSI
ncbi:MAG: hypothetical protein HC905_18640 [Bacteroidales bacterium]|nr:hypothetical protein [Bacteroidales bacterium]